MANMTCGGAGASMVWTLKQCCPSLFGTALQNERSQTAWRRVGVAAYPGAHGCGGKCWVSSHAALRWVAPRCGAHGTHLLEVPARLLLRQALAVGHHFEEVPTGGILHHQHCRRERRSDHKRQGGSMLRPDCTAGEAALPARRAARARMAGPLGGPRAAAGPCCPQQPVQHARCSAPHVSPRCWSVRKTCE